MEFLLMFAVLIGIVFWFFKALLFAFRGTNKVKSSGGNVSAFRLLSKLLGFASWERKEGAKFMEDKELKKVLNPRHDGLLIDGKQSRLTAQSSFTHNMVVAPTGAGKSTSYVIPNLLTLDDCSFVITDPSGELFKKTAGALQAKGFDIQILSPDSPRYSMRYNPLAGISSFTDITELATTLIESSASTISAGDRFWYDGAASLVNMIIRCLGVSGRENLNLGNVLHLLQNFGQDGRGIMDFVDKYGDDAAKNQLKGLINGNAKTTQAFLSTAMNALGSLNNPDMASLLSENEVDFQNLRKRKTAFFLILPSSKIMHYRFLMNLMYVDLFSALTKHTPDVKRAAGEPFLPVYCMMDEFGHARIKDFAVTCSTIRKYDVSLSIILQNFTQLEENYGVAGARTIIDGGMQSRLFYPGLPDSTAKQVESTLGKQVIREVRWKDQTSRTERNLLNADRIRTLPDNQAIFLTSNKEAMLLETLPCYQNKRFIKMMQQQYRGKRAARDLPSFRRVSLS